MTGEARKKANPPEPSRIPHWCSILAVDPGNTSGWAIYTWGRLVAYGKLTEAELYGDGPTEVIRRLIGQSGPHVVVLERPFRVRFQNQATMGAAMKMWAQRAKAAGLEERTLRVYPPTWRTILPPLPKGTKRDRKALREQEGVWAAQMLGQANVHPDIAPAVLMGRWAAYAGEVRLLIQGE